MTVSGFSLISLAPPSDLTTVSRSSEAIRSAEGATASPTIPPFDTLL